MSDYSNLKEKSITGFAWQLAQKLTGQLMSFVVTVILTRILLPEEYGIVAMAGMVLSFIGLFGVIGLQVSLIQKKDVDEEDLSTIFYAGFVMSVVLYAIVYFIAPFAASVFNQPLVCDIMRVSGLTFLIGAFGTVQNAIITRHLDFKFFFWASLVGGLFSAAVAIGMAYSGYGVWSLVAQSIMSAILNTLILFYIVRWHPKLLFSWKKFKTMFSFAWKQMMASTIATVAEQSRGYVIGIRYTASDLAFYNRGDGLPGIVYNQVNSTIQGVLFPVLSRLQDDKNAIKNGLSRSMKVSSYVLFPALLGLAAVSDKLVIILYTEVWLPAVPFMQLVCIIYCFSLIGGANTQAITAMGRSDIVLKWEMAKRPVMLGILCITAFISPLAIAIGQCIYAIGVCFFNAYPNKKILGYPIREQIKDIGGNFINSIIMVAVVLATGYMPLNIYVTLILQILFGCATYLGLSVLCHNESFYYILDFIQKRYKHGKQKGES